MKRRAGMIREEKFSMTGSGLSQKEQKKLASSQKDAENNNWKENLEYFDKLKKNKPERRNVLKTMKDAVIRH